MPALEGLLLATDFDRDDVRGWLDLKTTTGRYSSLLVEQLAFGGRNRLIDVFAVYDAIGMNEKAPYTRAARTIRPKEFRGEVLGGLWHLHYFEARHLATNITRHLLTKKSSEGGGRTLTSEDEFNAAIHDAVIGSFEQRSREHKLTGDWVIFAKREGVNYYLTLATHHEDDEKILERVLQAQTEFVELNAESF